MAIRIKNQWFNADKPKSPRETASAMAFIVWRHPEHGQADA